MFGRATIRLGIGPHSRFILFLLSSFFISSPNLSGRRLDVYHTSTHGVALVLKKFFPIVDTCLSCKDMARQSCAMVPRWRFFASCICSEPRAAHFGPAF